MNARPDPKSIRELQPLAHVDADGAFVPSPTGEQGWLIVVTKGQREKGVRDRLVAQGFEVYMPLKLLPQDKAMKRGITHAPLFPRIVLARATLDAYRWQVIFSTIGVTRVMCDPAKPLGLRPAFVDKLRAREIDGFLRVGLIDPTRPAGKAPTKDRRKWVKLDDVVDGLLAEPVDDVRKSVLVSLLNDGHDALTQRIRRK